MAVTTIGVTGATWGLTAETGVLIQTVSQKVQTEKNEVRNEIGEFKLVAYYNPLGKFTLAAVVAGSTGIAAAAPGVALTVANSISGTNGMPTGGIYTDDVEVAGGNTEFKKINVSATKYTF